MQFLFLHSNRVISGPLWGHVCLELDLRLARALKFSVLGHGGLWDKTMEYQILMITQKLYWTLFVFAVLQGYVEHQNFEEGINGSQVIKLWKFILWDDVKVIFVPSGSNGWHRFIV